MSDSSLSLRAGTLTSFEIQKHDPKRVSLFVDGQFAMGIHIELVYTHGLEKGSFLALEKLEALRDADHLWKAKSIALDFLAYKPRTEQEVKVKLEEQGFPEAIVGQVIERFRELGHLNDSQFAANYAQSRLQHKGHGPRKIKQDLRRKGVSTEDIEQAWDDATEQGEDATALMTLAAKRWQRLASESHPQKRRKKLQDFLLRRGFPFDQVRKVTQQLEQQTSSD